MLWPRQLLGASHEGQGAVTIFTSEIRAQLERILASPDFNVPERARTFLKYVVTETLSGRADRIKAYSIAVEVFGRDASFDPQSDPVVRIEAGRVRRALERYYLTAGSSDPIAITIPKGSYVPAFSREAICGRRRAGFDGTKACAACRTLPPESGGCGLRSLAIICLCGDHSCHRRVGGISMAFFPRKSEVGLARPRYPRAKYPETSGRAVSGCDWDRRRRNHRHRADRGGG